MEEKYYAILMNKKILQPDIYFFTPQILIEGKITEDNTFVDNIGNEFLVINNPEMQNRDEEIGVGFIIYEEDLLKRYPNNLLSDAKEQYFDEINLLGYIGFYIYQTDTIAIKPIDLKEMAAKLNSIDLLDDEFLELDLNGMNKIESSAPENNQFIVLNLNTFKELLQSKNYEEIKSKLENISPIEEKKKN